METIRATRRPLAALALLAALASPVAARTSLTVYTRDLGLVRETRVLPRSGGADTVRLADVPERLDFSSVRLVPAGGGRVTRLAWRWDVATADALLESARGKRVRITSRGDRAAEGTLVAVDGGWLVLRADDGTLLSLSREAVEEVRLTGAAGMLSTRPMLEAVVEGGRRGSEEAELTYLTGGLSWSAEHTVVRRGEAAATWSSAVTVQNATGRDFVDADLALLAGEPRREGGMPPPQPMLQRMMAVSDAAKEAAPDLAEAAFSEYHLYTLGRPATLRDRETQSFTMLEPRDIKVTPRYVYRGGDARGVQAQLRVANVKESGLGVPLPGGRVRFYEADAGGRLRFTGEARIGHTPERDTLALEMGTAFDLTAERREVANRRISDREREVTVEVKLRNAKKTEVRVFVLENVPGDSEVLRRSHPFVRRDAGTLEFEVPVPAGGEATLTYTARLRY